MKQLSTSPLPENSEKLPNDFSVRSGWLILVVSFTGVLDLDLLLASSFIIDLSNNGFSGVFYSVFTFTGATVVATYCLTETMGISAVSLVDVLS